MIAFGCSIADPEAYERYARPGIELAAEPGAQIHRLAAVESVARSRNLLLDVAARHDDLEALVLVDDTTEIADRALCSKVRDHLRDPAVAVIGCVGATGVSSLAWWDAVVVAGSVTHRYHEHGGGEVPAFAWTHPEAPPREVDTVAGFLVVLSPWAVRNVRFDEQLRLGFGYDLDYCFQVRSARRKVIVADLRAVHHHPLELVGEHAVWVEAHIDFARKWDGQMPGVDHETHDWRSRARRAEAEREAARTLAYSNRLLVDAGVLELERTLDTATTSTSWRITAPLRRLNHLRRRIRR